MKIVIFNVKYSPNLGDGVLARCLEGELARAVPGAAIATIDLAGRDGYGAGGGRGRRAVLRVLSVLPSALRRSIVARLLGRGLRNRRDEWQAAIADADAVVIGGGNLFQDDDLNFPLKVAAVLDCARLAGRPLAVYGVGVGARWSRPAARLFGALAHNRIVHLSVRDETSRDNWRRHLGAGYDVAVCHDPGLLAGDLLPPGEPVAAARSVRPLVGLCITHPLVLRRHADTRAIPMTSVRAYRRLVQYLVDSGCRVRLFTNGAAEDERFLERVFAAVVRSRPRAARALDRAPRPDGPERLVAALAGCDAVVAHRLHACIVAYALAVPHVGLGWDRKVESFFRSVRRGGFFLGGPDATAEAIGRLTLRAMREGVDAEAHAACLADARAAVARLARDMEGAARESSAA